MRDWIKLAEQAGRVSERAERHEWTSKRGGVDKRADERAGDRIAHYKSRCAQSDRLQIKLPRTLQLRRLNRCFAQWEKIA